MVSLYVSKTDLRVGQFQLFDNVHFFSPKNGRKTDFKKHGRPTQAKIALPEKGQPERTAENGPSRRGLGVNVSQSVPTRHKLIREIKIAI